MDTKEERLEKCLIKLNGINSQLEELASKSYVLGQYQIQRAILFVRYKSPKEGKAPSDETCHQMVSADPGLGVLLEEYYSIKFKQETLLEVSRNIRNEINALKGTVQEDRAVNGMFS